MGKFDGYLIGSDLDGTLLRKDKSISRENIDAAEYFKSEGGIFTFVTGRMPIGFAPVLNFLRPNGLVGCANGAAIYDTETEKFVWTKALDPAYAELMEFAETNFPDVGFELTTDKIYFCRKSPQTERHRIDEELPDLYCDYRTFSEPAIKVLFALEAGKVPEFERALLAHPKAELFDFIRSDATYYEVLPKGSGKGEVLLKTAELMGIAPEKTIAVGDNDNDVSMLSAAGIGIAVANASERAKSAADMSTVSNMEHAIARIIEDFDKIVKK